MKQSLHPAKALNITHDEWVSLLADPVMAAWVVFRIRLDVFQACRLRYYWWVQSVIDSSGVGTGKTIVDFLFLALRCVLIPQHHAAVFYPSFDTGKSSFWEYFGRFKLSGSAPVFLAQLGNPLKIEAGDVVDGDGTVHGPSCYVAYFRNGNTLKMPAPSIALDAVRAASLTVNSLIIEEWLQIDATSDAIDKQLLDRARGSSWNQYHPIWGNHVILSGHAQTRMHPGSKRFRAHELAAAAGDPTFANLHYSYKDFSNRPCEGSKTFQEKFRVESTIAAARKTASKSAWLGRYLGIWGANGEGWFTEESLLLAQANGRNFGLTPSCSRAEFEQSLQPPSSAHLTAEQL